MEMSMNNNIEMVNMDSKLVKQQNLVGTLLLSLDDVVLSKIIKLLDIHDLANLAGTCVRLENLTQQHVGINYTKINWDKDLRLGPNANIPNQSERVFKHFGKYFKTVELSFWVDEEFYETLVILANNCKQLETLILVAVIMRDMYLFDDKSIMLLFSKLKRFELHTCHWTLWCPLNFFFGENSTLEKLSIVKCNVFRRYSSKLQLNGLEALKDLQLIHCQDVVSEVELEECCRYNNITNLVISDVNNIVPLGTYLVDALFDKLESFSIDFSIDLNAEQLDKFQKLKILRLRCREESEVDQFLLRLGSNNLIEELEIKKFKISNATITALQNFKNLKRLRFDHSNNTVRKQFFDRLPKILPQLEVFVYTHSRITDCDIVYMLRLMPKLRRLSLFGCNQLANETFIEMEKILFDDWQRPKLQLIPPKFETFRLLKHIHIFTKILVDYF